MSNRPSKEKADRLRQLADLVDDMPHAVAWEVQRALREHADLVERPSEATETHSLKLKWEFSDGVECKVELHGTERDLKMMAARMEYYRRLEEASAPVEPGACQHDLMKPGMTWTAQRAELAHCVVCGEKWQLPLTKGDTP